ncbi:Solute carrier organic anion transporter family member 4A1 [Holothuria leucospilota]|uniref:Solute carrier organic anion transporter family member 4A1 n=1 Tax=Holothuria leucospilota TaxID=206669 RepID=A0A9Q0YD14_HOLLE|nr:Solute carrier organic anion transporter family member 4A1 [Holothuria leucospilota]
MVTDGFINTGITSIERRFQLSSTQSGIIVSIYFFTGIFVNLFVSYIGGRGHKARWLAGGMVLYAIGAMVYSLPHFLSGYYQYTDSDEYSSLCNAENSEVNGQPFSNSTDDGPSKVEDISNYLYFFVVAQVALGLGASPLYTLGIAYLDENVTVHRSGLYLGIFYAAGTLGPAVGYITGGTQELRLRKVSVAHKNSGVNILSARPDFGAKPMDFFIALKLLLRNPTMMFLNGVGVFESMMVMGFAAYLPKLVETQFGQTASFSAAVVGATLILGGSGGSILGGWLVKRFKWDIKSDVLFSIACTVGVVLLMGPLLLRCPSENIVGISDSVNSPVFLRNCTSQCSCSTQQYTPVCTLDGQFEFFSPCHAGCSQHFEDNMCS